MTYWKIEFLEKHLEIEKNNHLTEKATITKDYITHLETQLRLMKEAYESGLKDSPQTNPQPFKNAVGFHVGRGNTGTKDKTEDTTQNKKPMCNLCGAYEELHNENSSHAFVKREVKCEIKEKS